MTRALEVESHDTATADTGPPSSTEELHHDHVFSYRELARVDEALTMSSRETGLRFTLYIGDLGPRTRTARRGAARPVRRHLGRVRAARALARSAGGRGRHRRGGRPAACPTVPAPSRCCR